MAARMMHYSKSYMITMTIFRNLSMKRVRHILKVCVIWKCQFIVRNIRRSNETLKRSTQRRRNCTNNNSLKPIKTKWRVFSTIPNNIKAFTMIKRLRSNKRINGWTRTSKTKVIKNKKIWKSICNTSMMSISQPFHCPRKSSLINSEKSLKNKTQGNPSKM